MPDGDRWVTCGQGHTHWGAFGAAGLLISHTGPGGTRYLLQQRGEHSQYSQYSGTWSTPAGALHMANRPSRQRCARLPTTPA
jgi:8-oxo-dGTP diphosphatase